MRYSPRFYSLSFRKSERTPAKTACLSNEKQLGLAFTQYVQDADEAFPPIYEFAPGTNNVVTNWGQEIYPYVKSTGVYLCPDNPNAARYNPVTGTGTLSGSGNPASNGAPPLPVSYAYNYHVSQTWNGSPLGGNVGTGVPIALAAVNEPASKILVTESLGEVGVAMWDWASTNIDDFGANTGYNRGFPIHTSRYNCLFMDGHVKSLMPTQTASPINMWGSFPE